MGLVECGGGYKVGWGDGGCIVGARLGEIVGRLRYHPRTLNFVCTIATQWATNIGQ